MALRGVEYLASDQKRRLDYYGSRALAASLLPTLPILAGVVMLDHGTSNPFYRQQRVGPGGRPLDVLKFETLDKSQKQIQLHSGSNHPNATKVGNALRHKGLDELPQLLNVLRGEISLVGVRPVPQAYLDYYASFTPVETYSEWYESCYLVNQGVTGIGQLEAKRRPQSSEGDIVRRMQLEITARDTASYATDLQILIATPGVLLMKRDITQLMPRPLV